MKRNTHYFDQAARVLVALLCIYLGFFDMSLISDNLLAIVVGVFGIVNLYVGLTGFCPVYHLAGINTFGRKIEQG